jgi:rhamnosyltransferase subunit B
MARILFGWELGANRGHIERLLPMARRLLDQGHEVALALQQIDCAGLDRDPRITLWQAPVWPRLLINNLQDSSRQVATMGDILAQLGLDRPGCLAAMVSGWDTIFAAFRPDVVVADYAPALLTAAHGRIPTISVGDCFSCLPYQLERFPSLTGTPNAYDEDALLDTVDADLASVGRAPLAGLPSLFTADHVMVGSFAELDPYRALRIGNYCAPSIKLPLADGSGGGGDEVFVYAYNRIGADNSIWAGLAATRRTVRIHMRDPEIGHVEMFKQFRFIHEPKPVPFPLIAQRSCMAVSYGGNGFTSACLVAALPQLMMPFDLEKLLTAHAVDMLGFGTMLSFNGVTTEQVTHAVNAVAIDAAIAQRLHVSAPDFKSRMTVSMADEVVACIARLVG